MERQPDGAKVVQDGADVLNHAKTVRSATMEVLAMGAASVDFLQRLRPLRTYYVGRRWDDTLLLAVVEGGSRLIPVRDAVSANCRYDVADSYLILHHRLMTEGGSVELHIPRVVFRSSLDGEMLQSSEFLIVREVKPRNKMGAYAERFSLLKKIVGNTQEKNPSVWSPFHQPDCERAWTLHARAELSAESHDSRIRVRTMGLEFNEDKEQASTSIQRKGNRGQR